MPDAAQQPKTQHPTPAELLAPWENAVPAEKLLKLPSIPPAPDASLTQEDALKVLVKSAEPDEWGKIERTIDQLGEKRVDQEVREEMEAQRKQKAELKERTLGEMLESKFGELFYQNLIARFDDAAFQQKLKKDRYAETAQAVYTEMSKPEYLSLYPVQDPAILTVRFFARLFEKEFHDSPDTVQELTAKLNEYVTRTAETTAAYEAARKPTPPPIRHRPTAAENAPALPTPPSSQETLEQQAATTPPPRKTPQAMTEKVQPEKTIASDNPVAIPRSPKVPSFTAEPAPSPALLRRQNALRRSKGGDVMLPPPPAE